MALDLETTVMWELAKESAEKVAVIAATLSAKEAHDMSRNMGKMPVIKRLGELAGYLLRVSFVHDKCEDQRTGFERVYEFLEGLEQLCTFMCSSQVQVIRDLKLSQRQTQRFPMLDALKSWKLGEDSNLVDMIGTCLKAFVSTDLGTNSRGPKHPRQINSHGHGIGKRKSYVTDYFAFLESFSSTRDEAKNEAQATQADIAGRSAKDVVTPSDFPAHVHETFYGIIREYSQCCCASSGAQTGSILQHESRLRLKENIQINENHVVFDTVFSRNPRNSSAHGVQWQHLQFHIPRKKPGLAQVGFAVQTTSPQQPAQLAKPAAEVESSAVVKPASQFCGLLRERCGPAKICLLAKGTEIFRMPDLAEVVDDDIAHEQSISLADLLQHHDLVTKKRLLLAYVLAKAFWQFYNSDWMNIRWTTGTVQFFHERRGDDDDDDDDAVVLDENPYLIALPTAERNSSLLSGEHLPTACVVHRYPRLLSLGMLLLEIGRRKRQRGTTEQQGSRSEPEHETIEEKISNDLNSMKRALRRKTWPRLDVQEEVHETFRAVLDNCSNPKLFEAEPTGASSRENEVLTIEERRAIIYRRIVYPLKLLLEKLGWVDIMGNIKSQEDVNGDPGGGPDAGVFENTAVFLNAGSASESQTSSQQRAQQWLLRIQASGVTGDLLEGFQANRSLQRIRIAILDTGYDPESPFFCDPSRKRRIKRWKDMVVDDSTSGRVDEDGHGTHVSSLLMKVIPAADFYIARIARCTGDLANSTSNVARAIKWAAEEHQVDIISMSFGFDHEISVGGKMVISNALSDALGIRDQRILFFAAAANEGGNQPEMFPANHPHVISVRGTDDKGWLQRFNPPKGYTGIDCFMTLGQDVPGAGLSKHGGNEICKSGTSVSTPIAAGIAGMLLSYARLYGNDLKNYLGDGDNSSRGPALSTVPGMRTMFRKMSTEMLDGWYYLAADAFLRLPTHQARLAWIAV